MAIDVLRLRAVVIGDAKHAHGRTSVRLADPHLQYVAVRVMVEGRIIGPFPIFDAYDMAAAVHLDVEPRHERNSGQGENDSGLRCGFGRRHRSRRGQKGRRENGKD